MPNSETCPVIRRRLMLIVPISTQADQQQARPTKKVFVGPCGKEMPKGDLMCITCASGYQTPDDRPATADELKQYKKKPRKRKKK